VVIDWFLTVRWPGLVNDYMNYIYPISEAPIEFHIITLFSTVASLIGRNRYFIQGEDIIYANLFALIVAPSSLFKKTSAIGMKKKWLGRLQHMNGFLGHIGSPEGLFNGIRENNGFGDLFYSELGLLLAQSTGRQYMNDTLELLNDLYDCPDVYSKRMSGQLLTVNHVFLNLLSASQLDSLTQHVKEATLLSGFLPRFTVAYSETKPSHIIRRPEPDKKRQNEIVAQLKGIQEACSKPQKLDLTEDAWTAFQEWAQERYRLAEVASPQLAPMYGRLETHALKYGILLGVMDNPKTKTINPVVMSAATAVADFVLDSYRELVMEELTFTYHDKKLKKVSDIVKNSGKASLREITTATRYKRKELSEILEILSIMDKIRESEGPRGGKYYAWTGK
jgi:hypothetical protein